MNWYYVSEGESHGPLPDAQMAELLKSGGVLPDTLVWKEGMAAWIPFRESELAVKLSTASAGAARQLCVECRKPFPETEMVRYENSWVCAACKPIFIQRMMEGAVPQGGFVYANIGTRFAALLLDGVIVLALMFIFAIIPMVATATLVVGPNHETLQSQVWYEALFLIIIYGMGPVFEIFFVGRYGATPGKMLLGIKVVTSDGGRVSYGRSTGRYFGKIISGMILYVGYLMAFWDPERRALHDMMCGTRVVNRVR